MRKVFFIYCWLFALLPVFAQRPDSVQVNGQWYFIYPIRMKLEPSDGYLTVTGLTKTEFEQYRHWRQANDPRLNLEKDSLITALRKSIIDDKILTTTEYDDEITDYQDKVTHSHHCLFKLSPRWGIRRKLRHAQRGYRDHKSFIVRRNVNKRDLRRTLRKSPVLQHRQLYFTDYSLPPSEKNLPDGNYIMYYEDFFSADDWKKWKVNPQRVAAVFSLSDNLLNGDYNVFTYEGCQVVSGNYANGLRQDAWMMKVPYQHLERKEGWFFNRKYRQEFVKTDSLSYHFEADLLDGECGFFWCYDDKPIEKSWTGHFKNGFPSGEWVHGEFGNLIFKGNVAIANDAIPQWYAAKWIEAPLPASDSIYDFTQITNLEDYRMVLGTENGQCIENSGWAIVNKLKDYPLEYFVQSVFSPNTEISYYRFGSHCELYKEERPDICVARFYRNEDLKLIVGSRYFNNGVLFDTCGLDAQGQLIYRQFDNTGKLYLTAWLNEKGERIRSVYSTPEKKQFIDGYEVNRGFYGRTFYWEGDSVVADRRIFQLTWNEDKQLFYENYYDIAQQQLVEKRYDANEGLMTLGIIPFPNDSMTKFAAEYKPNEKRFKNYYKLCNRFLSIDSFQKQTVWGHLTFVQENSNGVSKVKLYVDGEPYSGDLEIRLKSKGYDRYKIKRNKLVFKLHPVYSGLQENIPLLFQLKIYGADTYIKGNYGIGDFFSGKGAMQNGIPQGKWLFYKHQLKAEMTYTGEQSSGFLYDHKIQKADLKWESEEYLTDPLKETYVPACKKSVSYVFRKTPIANRQKEGTCVMYNHIGDTVGLTYYKNGKLDGNQWYSFLHQYSGSGDTKRYLTGKFENGEATGTIVSINVGYETAAGGGKLVTDTLAVVTYANGKRNGAARYQHSNLQYEMTFANNLPEGGLTIKNRKNETVGRYFFKGGLLNTMQYFKENTLSYEYRIEEKDSFRLEINKLYELTDLPENDDQDEWKYLRGQKIDRDGTPEKSVFTKFYPDGSVARTGELISEKKTGRWAYASEDQTTRYTIDYKDSIYIQNNDTFAIIGVQANLDANGKEASKQLLLEEKDFYKCTSDEYYSIREYLVPESTLASEEVLYYYDNGALMSKGKLLNGLPDGLWQFYNQQGGLTRTGIYKNGKKIGRWLEGDLTTKAYLGDICLDESNPDLEVIISQLERGKKIAVTIYRDGKPASKQTFESSN